MKFNRRVALKGLTALGLAMTGVEGVAAHKLLSKPCAVSVIPLMAGKGLDGAFLSGIHQAAVQHQWTMHQALHLQNLDSADFVRLHDFLDRSSPAVLVGLADEASAVLVLALVRTSQGHLRISPTQGMPTRLAASQLTAALRLNPSVDGRVFCCTL